MSSTVTAGITLTIPSVGESASVYPTLMDTAFLKISGHDHSGGGNGLQLTGTSFSSNAFDDQKIRLRSNQYLRARNNANSGDVNLIKANAADLLELGASTKVNGDLTVVGTAVPSVASTYDVGSTALRWRRLHAESVRLINSFEFYARNAADNADVSLFSYDSSNHFNILTAPWVSNNTSINWKNSGGTVGMQMYVSGTDACFIDAAGGLNLTISGSVKWTLDSSGRFAPNVDGSYSIGSLTKRAATIYASELNVSTMFLGDAAVSFASDTIFFKAGGGTLLTLESSGHLKIQGSYPTGAPSSTVFSDATGWIPIKTPAGAVRYIPYYP